MIIIKIILITLFVVLCLFIISDRINHNLEKKLDKQIKLNTQLLSLFQNERDKTDTLYRIINHIKQQLSLLKLKECPEEEFKNIPFEIVDWIEKLQQISKGEDNGVHQ